MGGPFGVRGRGRSAGRYGRGGVPVSAGLLLFLGWILRGWYQENDGCESPKVGFPLTTNPLLQSENPHPLRPNQPRLPLPPNLHPSLPQLHVVDHFLVRRLPRPLRTPRPLQAANLHALRRLGPHGRLRRAPRAVRRRSAAYGLMWPVVRRDEDLLAFSGCLRWGRERVWRGKGVFFEQY